VVVVLQLLVLVGEMMGMMMGMVMGILYNPL
jgi:hypothetical protein